MEQTIKKSNYFILNHSYIRTWNYIKDVSKIIKSSFGVEPRFLIIHGNNYSAPGTRIKLTIENITYILNILQYKHKPNKTKITYNLISINQKSIDIRIQFKIYNIDHDKSSLIFWTIYSKNLKEQILKKIDFRIMHLVKQTDKDLRYVPTIQSESIKINIDFNLLIRKMLNYKTFFDKIPDLVQKIEYKGDILTLGKIVTVKLIKNEKVFEFKAKIIEILEEDKSFKLTMNMIGNNSSGIVPNQNLVWFVYKISEREIFCSFSHICMIAIPKEYLYFLSKAKQKLLNNFKNTLEI